MINNNVIIVFDFETSGLDPENDEAVQVAALAIDPHSLEIIPDSQFESLMKPVKIFTGSEAEVQAKWNKCQGAWNVNKKTRAQLEKAPLPEHVWKAFADHVKKYHSGGWNGKPIPAGHNIQGFDLAWVDVLCRRHGIAVDKSGKQQIFNTRTILDTLNLAFLWHENSPEPPDLKMDSLRSYYGIDGDGAHDALIDVRHTALVLTSFMKIHRYYSPKVKFKNAFARKSE